MADMQLIQYKNQQKTSSSRRNIVLYKELSESRNKMTV